MKLHYVLAVAFVFALTWEQSQQSLLGQTKQNLGGLLGGGGSGPHNDGFQVQVQRCGQCSRRQRNLYRSYIKFYFRFYYRYYVTTYRSVYYNLMKKYNNSRRCHRMAQRICGSRIISWSSKWTRNWIKKNHKRYGYGFQQLRRLLKELEKNRRRYHNQLQRQLQQLHRRLRRELQKIKKQNDKDISGGFEEGPQEEEEEEDGKGGSSLLHQLIGGSSGGKKGLLGSLLGGGSSGLLGSLLGGGSSGLLGGLLGGGGSGLLGGLLGGGGIGLLGSLLGGNGLLGGLLGGNGLLGGVLNLLLAPARALFKLIILKIQFLAKILVDILIGKITLIQGIVKCIKSCPLFRGIFGGLAGDGQSLTDVVGSALSPSSLLNFAGQTHSLLQNVAKGGFDLNTFIDSSLEGFGGASNYQCVRVNKLLRRHRSPLIFGYLKLKMVLDRLMLNLAPLIKGSKLLSLLSNLVVTLFSQLLNILRMGIGMLQSSIRLLLRKKLMVIRFLLKCGRMLLRRSKKCLLRKLLRRCPRGLRRKLKRSLGRYGRGLVDFAQQLKERLL